LINPTGLGVRNTLKLPLPAQIGLEFGKHTSMSRKHIPVVVPVSMGCSVALKDAPRAFTVRTT
jgi:hypothetical protein